MLRMVLSVMMMAVMLAPLLPASVSYAQGAADSLAAPRSSGGAASLAADYAFWILILLAVFFLYLACISYASAFKGPDIIRQGHRRILGMAAAVILAVLSKMIVFVWL